jgi:hypothetical protein
MSKENLKKVSKEFPHQFLPPVDEKIVIKMRERLFSSPKEFIREGLSRMDEKNPGFCKFLLWKAKQSSNPHSFRLGSSFVYLNLLEKFEKDGKPFLEISRLIFEDLSQEIEDEDEDYFQKKRLNKQRALENLKDNFQTTEYFDEDLGMRIFSIDTNNQEKIREIVNNFFKENSAIGFAHEKRISSIIPHPNFYYQENPSLMENINLFPIYVIGKPISPLVFSEGAMLTYEISRRQAESDFLSRKFGVGN